MSFFQTLFSELINPSNDLLLDFLLVTLATGLLIFPGVYVSLLVTKLDGSTASSLAKTIVIVLGLLLYLPAAINILILVNLSKRFISRTLLLSNRTA